MPHALSITDGSTGLTVSLSTTNAILEHPKAADAKVDGAGRVGFCPG